MIVDSGKRSKAALQARHSNKCARAEIYRRDGVSDFVVFVSMFLRLAQTRDGSRLDLDIDG